MTYEGATIKCVSATGIYKVNSEGTALTLEGVIWKECKALGSLEAKVTRVSTEAKQPTKEGTEQGKAVSSQISSECVVKVGTVCEIGFPVEGNKEVKTVAMKKSGLDVDADAEITGITATAKGSCCALGGLIKEKTTSATLKMPGEVDEGLGLE